MRDRDAALLASKGQQCCSVQRRIAHGAYAAAQDRRHKTHGFEVVGVNVFAQRSGQAQVASPASGSASPQQRMKGKGKGRLDLQQFFHICGGQPQTVWQAQPGARRAALLAPPLRPLGSGSSRPAASFLARGMAGTATN